MRNEQIDGGTDDSEGETDGHVQIVSYDNGRAVKRGRQTDRLTNQPLVHPSNHSVIHANHSSTINHSSTTSHSTIHPYLQLLRLRLGSSTLDIVGQEASATAGWEGQWHTRCVGGGDGRRREREREKERVRRTKTDSPSLRGCYTCLPSGQSRRGRRRAQVPCRTSVGWPSQACCSACRARLDGGG